MDREHTARRVRERREELGMTQEDVATSGGPSTATLRLIENASPTTPRLKSQRQLENALDWEPGSYRALMQGGEPTVKASAARPTPRAQGGELPHYEDGRLEIFRNTAVAMGLDRGVARGMIEWLKDELGIDEGRPVSQRRAG